MRMSPEDRPKKFDKKGVRQWWKSTLRRQGLLARVLKIFAELLQS